MLCDMCNQNEAVVHTKIIRNGIVRVRHLCAECSRKLHDEESFAHGLGSIEDVFSSLSGLMLGGSGAPQRTVCKMCGTTSDEFLKTGYVGCPDCYKAFENVIMPAIRRTQHDTHHVGKVPGSDRSRAAVQAKIERLREQQRRAAEAENYEEASRLRDEVNKLIASANKGGKDNE